MTSRERVLAAATGKKPDRVPIYMWLTPFIVDRLKKERGADDPEDSLGMDLRMVDYHAAPENNDFSAYTADFPANTTVTRCITWQVPPGAGHVCLQVKIEQENYEDIVSQMNIDTVGLPGVLLLPAEFEFDVGNPTGETATVQLDTEDVGLPDGFSSEIAEGNEVTLEPGETVPRTLRIQSAAGLKMLRVNDEVLPGDAHLVSVEAFIDDELIGGVQFEFEVHEVYLPIILKKHG